MRQIFPQSGAVQLLSDLRYDDRLTINILTKALTQSMHSNINYCHGSINIITKEIMCCTKQHQTAIPYKAIYTSCILEDCTVSAIFNDCAYS